MRQRTSGHHIEEKIPGNSSFVGSIRIYEGKVSASPKIIKQEIKKKRGRKFLI
jgi:hypothetical protein